VPTIATYPPGVHYELAFNSDPTQSAVPPFWQDLVARARYAWDAGHGRQYELDVNETGEWNLRLNNDDGALDPGNAASPYAPNVKLYRKARTRLSFGSTQNLLPQVIATGSATMNPATDSVGSWWSVTAGTLSQGVNLTAAPSGQTTAVAWALPAGSTAAGSALYDGVNTVNPTGPAEDTVQVVAGLSYTRSVYLSRTASADATVTMTAVWAWFGPTGTSLGTTTGAAATVPTAGWVRATVTGTAPAGAAWGRPLLRLATPSPTTAANVVYATGGQVEQAAAATAWADPGATGFVCSGIVERIPQVWTEMDSTSGTAELFIPDMMAAFATYTLLDPFVNEVFALGPNFCYLLNDPANAAAVADAAGRRTAAPVENSPYGAGSLTFGNAVAATNNPGLFVGVTGTVATFNNNPANTGSLAQTFISLDKTAAVPGPPSAGAWTRMIAFRASAAPSAGQAYNLWTAGPPAYSPLDSFFSIGVVGGTGQLAIQFADNVAAGTNWVSASSICDGNWHLAAVGADPATGQNLAWLDGALVATVAGVGSGTGWMTDVLGVYRAVGVAGVYGGFRGDLACAVELPTLLTTAQALNLYNSWRTASSGESTGARIQRILAWVGYTGRTSIDVGMTTSMGPATDLTGTTALDAFNAVAVTENGDVYMSAAGVFCFRSRAARYNQRTPVYIFGEGPSKGGAAGEWPCEAVAFEFDPSHLANTIQISQWGGPDVLARNAASAAAYFPRTYQRTINTSSLPEALDAATYLLAQLKDPHRRIDTIVLHPSAVPGLFAVCAALEKGVRIRLIKRPVGAPSITVDAFVEQVNWNWDTETGEVFVTLQASPADLTAYWVLAALHTTLSVQAAAAQNKATIVALPDAASNVLAASLPSAYSLTFEPGTSRQETLALAAGGIPSTTVGYASAQLTFATNFAFTHGPGTVVCEPLPAGYTDPTTWDASSVIGAAYTTVVSGGTAGTATVTVGALADAATNALGSNWNTGDVIWLGAGTANFEAVTILAVATTYPGYTSCQITLTANLAHSHNPGEWVSDVLPAGVTDPTTLTPTARRAY
jgi:hypothetical protein